MRRLGSLLAMVVLAGACGGREGPGPAKPAAPAPSVTAAAAPSATAMLAETASLEDSAPPAVDTTGEDAERVLFLATHLKTTELRLACPKELERDERIRCLLSLRYADVPDAKALAMTLYSETGSLAGLLPEETSDDGQGGKVHLLPARPIGPNLEHFRWILDAFRDYRKFTSGLSAKALIAFTDRPVHFRFFYSEKGGNPSAFAIGRNIGYNLYGSLNVSDVAVRDTLFHEIFHLNDSRRGDWSARALAPIFEQIVARCGKSNACLSPYAPTDTMIQGFYYAFVRQTGAREYAAELGLRYYREHRLVLEGKPLPVKAFKCGPPENMTAWKLVADELFGGVDLVPPC